MAPEHTWNMYHHYSTRKVFTAIKPSSPCRVSPYLDGKKLLAPLHLLLPDRHAYTHNIFGQSPAMHHMAEWADSQLLLHGALGLLIPRKGEAEIRLPRETPAIVPSAWLVRKAMTNTQKVSQEPRHRPAVPKHAVSRKLQAFPACASAAAACSVMPSLRRNFAVLLEKVVVLGLVHDASCAVKKIFMEPKRCALLPDRHVYRRPAI